MESNRPSQPWKSGDELEAVRLEQMRHNAEAARLTAASKNVRLFGSSQGNTAIAVDDPVIPVAESIVVRLMDTRTRGGCYKALVCYKAIDGGSDGFFDTTATSENFGALFVATEGTQEEVTAVNLQENGGSPLTHYLMDDANDFQHYYIAQLHPTVDDTGKRVVVFNGHWSKVCTPTP